MPHTSYLSQPLLHPLRPLVLRRPAEQRFGRGEIENNLPRRPACGEEREKPGWQIRFQRPCEKAPCVTRAEIRGLASFAGGEFRDLLARPWTPPQPHSDHRHGAASRVSLAGRF